MAISGSVQPGSHKKGQHRRFSEQPKRLEPVETFNQNVAIAVRPELNRGGLPVCQDAFGEFQDLVLAQRLLSLEGNPYVADRNGVLFQHRSSMGQMGKKRQFFRDGEDPPGKEQTISIGEMRRGPRETKKHQQKKA